MNKKSRVYGKRMPKRQPKPRTYGDRLTVRQRRDFKLPERAVFKPKPDIPFPSSPHEFVWYALTTMPQSEGVASAALHRAGFVVFNPVENVQIRGSRRTKFTRHVRQRSMMTSYIFLGFPFEWVTVAGKEMRRVEVPWLTLLGFEHVTGMVRFGGMPSSVPFSTIMVLRAKAGCTADTRHWSPALDQPAMITTGPWSEHQGNVEKLSDGKAWVKLILKGTGALAKMVDPLVRVDEITLAQPGSV